ncbi:MAG: YicC/YloC family endoribonuclease [Desulfobacterales bacterium]|nr:YicC/YloC family endoribonuclease [Desulfobacterales bacterium]
MIKSMTGFAAAEVFDGDLSVSTDIRAVNSRHLDLALRIPAGFSGLEEKIKGLINRKIVRGRLEVKIQIKDATENAIAFEIDWARAEGMYAAIKTLTDKLGLQNNITVDHLLSVGGIVRPVETVDESEKVWETVETCLERALADLDAMRRKEGEFIANDLFARLDFIESDLAEIEDNSANLIERYQERLMERIAVLTKETVEIDPARLAQEAAYLADRSDISEEIVRAKSHIEQFRQIMQSKEPGGRKLNFLLQELHREFNTIGSKIGHAETAHRVVEVKAELEKIREQIQNVE